MDMSWDWDLDRRGSLVSGIGQGNHDSRYSLTMINIVTSSYKLSLECHAFISLSCLVYIFEWRYKYKYEANKDSFV